MSDRISELVEQVAPLIHDGRRIEAAQLCSSLLGSGDSGIRVDTEELATQQLSTLLSWCLKTRRLPLAAKLLWPASLFTPGPRSVRMIWENIEAKPFVILPGASSMGKSYTPGVYFFLEWLCDPKYTQVLTIGPSEEHLQSNLFSHLVNLHQLAALPVPGHVGSLFIGLDPRNRKSSISGRVIPIGKASAGRLQGTKRTNRPSPHPLYGDQSRLFLLIDELENVPPGLYSDLDNVCSNHSEGDNGFKIVASYNPKDITLEPGRLTEPLGGWDKFNIETDEVWDSKRGWRVVRLDAEKSENVVQQKRIYPGLQSYSALKTLAAKTGGTESASYYTFGRGAYPPTNTAATTVVPRGMLDSYVGELVWVQRPQAVGGCDLALDGGDSAKMAYGLFGTASGYRLRDDVTGKLVYTRFPVQRRAIQLVDIHTLPKGDTVAMSEEVKRLCRKLLIQPHLLCVDSTGHTRGVSDLLKRTFGDIIPVNSSESPTNIRITESDPELPNEDFDRIASELWFALRYWSEYESFWFHPDFDRTSVVEQLSGRRYAPGRVNKVEEKKAQKIRNQGRSPDDADAATLLVHAVRSAFRATLTGQPGDPKGSSSKTDAPRSGVLEGIDDRGYVDPTNRLEDFDL